MKKRIESHRGLIDNGKDDKLGDFHRFIRYTIFHVMRKIHIYNSKLGGFNQNNP
jgi:hypothetical protein